MAGCFTRKYTPPPKQTEDTSQEAIPAPAYDVWGRSISESEAAEMMKSKAGRQTLSPGNGAVKIDDALLKRGKEAFYEETFGNEIFLTDVLGMLDGPITPAAMAKALAGLKGEGTTNLRVELAKDAVVGGKQFHKGDVIDTGLDVPKGAIAPLGMVIAQKGTRTYVGVTCALCHSSVDPKTLKVIHGMPNGDFNAGLMLAMASNTAAFFTHADVPDLNTFVKDQKRTVMGQDRKPHRLPDPQELEGWVDATLMKWPPGNFDSMTDGVANPSQLPTAWTMGNHPYSFSGAFMAGPFRGLSVQNNNVHSLNSDPFTQADAAPKLFGIDKEVYVATILQNAPSDKFRYDPAKGQRPSDFLNAGDPTPGQPGMNKLVALPTFPRATLIEPTGLWNSLSGESVWRSINAMSAWQNTLVPPPAPLPAPGDPTLRRGREVFERAGCAKCHSGPFLTNNRIVPATEVKTQPIRAKGMMNTGFAWEDKAIGYAFDQSVPLPRSARTLTVPTERFDREQVRLAYGWGDSPGGYKVPALVGLFWTAPYLHDGGVAVGPDADKQLGLPGTLLNHTLPDPGNSLRALVDRELRRRVTEANHADKNLAAIGVEGIGHEYWVDSPDDQRALVAWLLAYRAPVK